MTGLKLASIAVVTSTLFMKVEGQPSPGNNPRFCPPTPTFFLDRFGDDLLCLTEDFFTPPEIVCGYDPVSCRLSDTLEPLPPGSFQSMTECSCVFPDAGWVCQTEFIVCPDAPVFTDCGFDREYLPETGDACSFAPDKVCRYDPQACRTAQEDDAIEFAAICTCTSAGTMECTNPFDDSVCDNSAVTPTSCPLSDRQTNGIPDDFFCTVGMEYKHCRYTPIYCPDNPSVDPVFADVCRCRKGLFNCNEPKELDCGPPMMAEEPEEEPPEMVEEVVEETPPSNNGMSDMCFPESAQVQVLIENEKIVSKEMKDLKIGDWVQVDAEKATFEPVYSFSHWEEGTKISSYVEINRNKLLRISPRHLVWNVLTSSFVAAGNLQIGDVLLQSDSTTVVIDSIRLNVTDYGAYAPTTPSGTIVVNGIQTSCYTNVLSWMKDHTFHVLAHWFVLPHRLACHYLSTCPNESYTKDGISTWLAGPYTVLQQTLMPHQSNQYDASYGFSSIVMMSLVAFVGMVISRVDGGTQHQQGLARFTNLQMKVKSA